MNITELDSYNLADAVKFHTRLNPGLWGKDEHLRPEVRKKLLEIAEYFQEFLGLDDLKVKDITISGSNAAYSYTTHSDIDLHLVVEIPPDPVYRELFNAKKYEFNDTHDIRIRGADVELYVQDADETPVSLGEYSIKNNEWIQVPRRKRAKIDQSLVRHKYEDLQERIKSALAADDADRIGSLIAKIKTMRQAGLDAHGEFGPENLAFKMLRTQGLIKQLYDARAAARDRELSLKELQTPRRAVRYGFSESSSPNGVSPETKMFLSEVESENVVRDFIAQTAKKLNIRQVPKVNLHRDDGWSQENSSFGRYEPDTNELHVSLINRHLLDILRTTAHELAHCRQNELSPLPDRAGETGSKWENQANAMAGVIMRDWADAHPDHFASSQIEESSGYIPTAKEKNDPRFKTALSVDVHPGQTGREANKMGLQTDAQGKPALLIKSLKNALREFKETGQLVKEQDLLEIRMTSSNLRQLAAQTGAQAGMEFEMIVPNVESESESEMEPDYDYDERSRSFGDIRAFFHDGDYNGRREVDNLIEELAGEYEEWKQEQTAVAWQRDGQDYIYDFVTVNNLFDRDEALDQARDEVMDANPDLPQESEDFSKLLTARLDEMEREFAASELENQGRTYNDAFEAFAEEQNEEYDEGSFLDDKYPYMTDVQGAFDIQWPHWYDINDVDGGEMDVDQVADEFSSYMGKPVNASRQYHGGRREAGTYVVEPDGSLEGDNPGDGGLEFVSPPMPIDEMISDLNKVKAWADKTGCYTNDSTGLHINISVPNYSLEKLDYVKLALLMGDEYVLDLFGRSGNSYAKSAISKIKGMLQKNPDVAPQVMDKMREHMEDIATKAIHSGITDKYTSINTKSGYIEFRSPGGDWLDSNFSKIEDTLMRFTVALSAAIDPEAYRQEYLKKLYKLLEGSQDKGGPDVLQLFANYSAGELDKAALIRQVREKQLARDVARGKAPAGQQYWWNVQWDANRRMEVVASNKAVAREVAAEEWGVPVEQLAVARVTMLRPYEPPAPKPTAEPSTGNWGIWMSAPQRFARAPGQVDNNVLRRFPSQAAAMAFLERTREENPNMRTDIEVREIESASQPVPGSTLDLQRQQAAAAQPQFQEPDANRGDLTPRGPGPWEIYRLADGASIRNLAQTNRGGAEHEARAALGLRGGAPELYGVRTRASTDAAQGGTVDVATDRAAPAAGQPAFTGNWLIKDAAGTVLHSFGGIGNNQSDANRIAMQWLRSNPRLIAGGVEVVPEMA